MSLGRLVRTTLLLSTVVAAAAAPQAVFISDAHAASAKRRVAVGAFHGRKAAEVRSEFITALKGDGSYDVTDAEDVKSTKAQALMDAAKGLDVQVIITGRVSWGYGLTLKVYSGADGKVLDEASLKGGTLDKLKANIDKSGVSSVAAAIAEVPVEEPPPEEPPAEETPTEEESEEASEEGASDGPRGPSPLDLTAGLRPMHRTFEFKNTLADKRPNQGFRPLRRYELPLGPVVFVDLNWYPGSHFASGAAELIGLSAGFEKGFATESVFAEGTAQEQVLKTDEMQWYLGPKFRLPFGEQRLAASAVFGQHSFTLKGDEAVSLVPDVKYTFVRAMLEGDFRIGELVAGARIGKRFVFGTGDIEKAWFPNAKASSLEAGVTVGYRLASSLDLVLGFDWLRYAFDFNPVAQPPMGFESFVAGGAVDQYLTGHIAFRFHLPGSTVSAAASASSQASESSESDSSESDSGDEE